MNNITKNVLNPVHAAMLFEYFTIISEFNVAEYVTHYSGDDVDPMHTLWAKCGAPLIVYPDDSEVVCELWVFLNYDDPMLPITEFYAGFYPEEFDDEDHDDRGFITQVVIRNNNGTYDGYATANNFWKIGNAIIAMCKEYLELSHIFNGRIECDIGH